MADSTAALAQLHRQMQADPALQARLFALDNAEDFVAAVRATVQSFSEASGEASHLAVTDVQEGMLAGYRDWMSKGRWPGDKMAGAFSVPETGEDGVNGANCPAGPGSLDGWVPMYLSVGAVGEPQVNWAYMGEERFTEPFCLESFQRLASRPFNRLFRRRSGLDLLRARGRDRPGLPLRGLVFHMSRCGSTLTAQWLTAMADTVVLSEPEPVDALLQWPQPYSDMETLRALVAALGQPRRAGDRSLFVKTDAWHMLHIDRLLTAFPDTPWVFLYRDPVEVLVSQQRLPGMQLVPGGVVGHGLQPPAEVMRHPLAHGAWLLSVILERAAKALRQHGNGLLLNYTELPEALDGRLLKHFGIDAGLADTDACRAVLTRDAKQPRAAFQADGLSKRAEADDEVKVLAARWLEQPYLALERLRAEQESGIVRALRAHPAFSHSVRG